MFTFYSGERRPATSRVRPSTERNFGDHAVSAVLPGLFDGHAGRLVVPPAGEHPALRPSGIGELLGPDSGTRTGTTPVKRSAIWGHRMAPGNLGLCINRSFQSHDGGNMVVEGAGSNGRNVLGLRAGYDLSGPTTARSSSRPLPVASLQAVADRSVPDNRRSS